MWGIYALREIVVTSEHGLIKRMHSLFSGSLTPKFVDSDKLQQEMEYMVNIDSLLPHFLTKVKDSKAL